MGLEIVELVMRMEEEFEIDIPDQDAEKFTTIGEISDYLAARLHIPEEEHAQLWTRVHAIAVDELSISPDLIRRDARMVEDLGLG
jgi:hypothetical protein